MKKNILQRRRLEKEVPFLAPDCSTIFVRRAPQKNPIKDILNKKIEDPLDALDESFSTATDNSLTTTINEFFKNSDDVKMQDSGEELGYRSSSSISESDEPKVVHATQICNECETKNTIVKDLKKEIETKNKTIEGLNKENDEIAEATEKSLLEKKQRLTPEISNCLGVFGLSMYTTECKLEKEFSKFGPLEYVTLVMDGRTGQSRRFAFIYFESQEDAKAAKEAMSDQEIHGRRVRVDFSITKSAHTRTPGVYMGRPTYRGGDTNIKARIIELHEEESNQLKENLSSYKAANQSLQLEKQELFKEKESVKEVNHSLQKENESLDIKLTEANLRLFDVEEQISQKYGHENNEEILRLTKKVEYLEDQIAQWESPDGVKQLKDSIVIYEQRVVNDGEKIKMLEKENEELKNNLDVNSFLLPPIEESKLAMYPLAQENDTLKAQATKDKEKIGNLEKEIKVLKTDLNGKYHALSLRDALRAQAKKDEEKIENLEKEVEGLKNELDVISSKKLLPESAIEESKIVCVDCKRWESLALNYIEKIESLEKEVEQLRNDLDSTSSENLLPDSGLEESKIVIADENDTLKAEAEKDKAEIELLKTQVNFLKKDTMAEKIVELSSTNKILIGENYRLKLEAEEHEIYQENANQNLEHHMYEYRKQLNLDVKEFKETQVKIIELEKDNQKLKSNCDKILRDNQQSLANLREKILNLEKSNLNLKAENQKMKAQCNQISQDKQQISAKFRENVTKMREMEELNFTLKSECDQYLEFSESAMEDQEILEKRLKEMVEEKNPDDCVSKKCEKDKNDLNGRIAEEFIYNTIGYLELQKVHKQYKVEVDELKKKLQSVNASLNEKLVKSCDQISQDRQQISANLKVTGPGKTRKLEELNHNLNAENQKLKAQLEQISQFSRENFNKVVELQESNLNLEAENQKLIAQCGLISHDKQQMRFLEEFNLNLKAENQKLKAQCDQILQEFDASFVTMQEKQDEFQEAFSNNDTKICTDCESKNQDIENFENEIKEMKMKLEIKGLFFDPNDPTFTKWISPIFKLAPILKKILSAHVPIPLAITYGSTPKNGQKEVGYLQPAEIANFCEMWQLFMDFCQQQKQ